MTSSVPRAGQNPDPEPPRTWWSPSLGYVQLDGADYWTPYEIQWQGLELPADAVELRPVRLAAPGEDTARCGCADADRTYTELADYCEEIAKERDVLVAALAARTPQPPERTDEHVYLSTSCLHFDHGYCGDSEGYDAAGDPFPKRPGQCKWCCSPCVCECHVKPSEPT